MFLVDTNVLVYAADEATPEHPVCHALLEGWRTGEEPWFATWSVIYEFLAVTTRRGLSRNARTPAEAWAFARALLATPSLSLLDHTPEHGGALGELVESIPRIDGNFFHDAHIAALMVEHGVRTIYTRDNAFRRFPFLEVIDPLQA